VADFYEIAEDRGETDLQRFDACAFDLALLEGGDPAFAFERGGAEFIEGGIETGFDKPAVADDRGWFGDDGLAEFFAQLGKGVEAFYEAGEKRGGELEGVRPTETGGERRNEFEGLGQGGKVAGVSGGPAEAGCRTLDVADFGEAGSQVAKEHGVVEQGGDGFLAALDRLGIAEWVENPVTQQPCSHGRAGCVEGAEECHLAAGAGLDELEVALGGGVENEKFAAAVGLEAAEVSGGTPHLARDVMKQSPGGACGSG